MAWKNSSIIHEDGRTRCGWPDVDPLYVRYHDTDWGVPEYDSRALFEKLILDGFQAGLSWITILRKRDAFCEVFDHFDAEKIVRYDEEKLTALMNDARIVRNRAKILACVSNARVYLDIEENQGFDNYLWNFMDGKPLQNRWNDMSDVPVKTDIAEAIAKDLKRRGFKFCGPTIVYAFMQAVGMVNDHLVDCFRHEECRKLAK
jgi:DNA-3-methyladenine glycosylase I